ncbi:hypothetical protein ACUL41_02340 [Virgibacillus natechei]|uniref:hypothetical protein n=1 Tax=Virgibacillus sp. CBA3643 TaxID=2942278 RepID=UPI0035A2AA1C
MEEVNHKPMHYTNQSKKAAKANGYLLAVIFVLLSAGGIGAGIYWLLLEGDHWIGSFLVIPIGLFMGFIAWIFYDHTMRENIVKYEFVLHEKGIDEKRHYMKKEAVTENHIAFNDMDKVLIGNYVDRIIKRGPDIFRFGCLSLLCTKTSAFLSVFSKQMSYLSG